MKTRSIIARVLLTMLCVVLLISGCGKTEPTATNTATPTPASNAPASTEPTPTATQESSAPKDTVDLTFYCVGDPTDTTDVVAAVNDYLKDKLNINLKYEMFGWGDTYTPKINPMLAAGEPIDIIFTSNWAANYRQNATSGYFLPLNDYLAQSPAVEQVLGKDFMNATQINGVNYALPCNKEKVHNWGFLLKTDLVKKWNIDTTKIKTLEDLEPWFDKVLAEEKGMTPLCVVQMDAPWHLLDWNNFSDDDVPGALYPDNRNTTVINQFLAPEAIAQYTKMRDYYKKGYIHKDAATQDNFSTELSTGKYFAFVAPLKPGKDAEMTVSTKVEWTQIDITPVVMSNRESDGAMLAIAANSKNPDRAFKFIEMLYTDPVLKNLMNFGVENKHYTKVSDNVIKPVDGASYKTSGGWRFGDQFKDFLTEGEDSQKWDKFIQYNSKGLPLNNLGFVFDSTNVQNEIAACKNVVQTYYKTLFTGSDDPDKIIKQMESEFKASGVDTIIKEMQTQFDAWLKANGK